jgi:NTP pyrophosphatase (non-canonical NTP hydrolase)
MEKSIWWWCAECHRVAGNHGFQCPSSLKTAEERTLTMEKLMLITTEVAEAAEAVRHEDFDNFKEELADTVIRIFDLCEAMDIDLEGEIAKKNEANRSRPHLHGKKL